MSDEFDTVTADETDGVMAGWEPIAPEDAAAAMDHEARAYVAQRRVVEALDAQLKEEKRLLEAHSQRLFEVIETAGMKSYPHALGRLTRTVRIQGNVKDAAKFQAYIEKTGHPEKFFNKPALSKAKLNALAKEIHEHGAEVDGLEPFVLRSITFTAAPHVAPDEDALTLNQED